MEKRQYRFAFDIGIGSCGWAVVLKMRREIGESRMRVPEFLILVK